MPCYGGKAGAQPKGDGRGKARMLPTRCLVTGRAALFLARRATARRWARPRPRLRIKTQSGTPVRGRGVRDPKRTLARGTSRLGAQHLEKWHLAGVGPYYCVYYVDEQYGHRGICHGKPFDINAAETA